MDYHPLFGYPTNVNIDKIVGAVDDEMGYTINHMDKMGIIFSDPVLLSDINDLIDTQSLAYSIASIDIAGDALSLSFTLSSSCGSAYFELAISTGVQNTIPPQIDTIIMARPSNDDVCDNPQSYQVEYNLSELKQALQKNGVKSPVILAIDEHFINYIF